MVTERPVPNPLAVVGSRQYPDLREVRDYVRALPKGTLIVSGGAMGVDDAAVTAAQAAGLPKPVVFEANWKRHGKRAGHVRNDQIIDFLVGYSGGLTAFWDGKSPGTAGVIEKARKAGVLYEVKEGEERG